MRSFLSWCGPVIFLTLLVAGCEEVAHHPQAGGGCTQGEARTLLLILETAEPLFPEEASYPGVTTALTEDTRTYTFTQDEQEPLSYIICEAGVSVFLPGKDDLIEGEPAKPQTFFIPMHGVRSLLAR